MIHRSEWRENILMIGFILYRGNVPLTEIGGGLVDGDFVDGVALAYDVDAGGEGVKVVGYYDALEVVDFDCCVIVARYL